MADNVKTEKPRMRVVAGRRLSEEQIIDAQSKWFFSHLIRTDTNEVLKKAGIGRHKLEILLSDDSIDSKIDRRKETLSNTGFILSPNEGKVAKFVHEQLEKHLGSILIASIDSKMYGYDVAEMIWDVKSQVKSVVKVVSKPIEWFEPRNTGELHYFPNNNSNPIELTGQDDFYWRFLYQRHEPTFKNPKGKSLLSRIYWLWYFKTNGWRFWSKYLERFGSPLIIGKSDAESETEMQAFADSLLSAHNAGVVAVSKDEDVVAVESKGNGEAFAKYDDAIDKRISQYLLGQTLTSGTDAGGTYGQGKVHQEQQEIIFNADRKHALKAIQHFINVICHANGYEPPQFEWASDEDFQPERTERDNHLYAQGFRFTSDYYQEKYRIEKRYIATVNGNASNITTNSTHTKDVPVAQFANLSYTPNSYHQASFAENKTADKFTPEQMQVEGLVAEALSDTPQPIDPMELRKAILKSKDVEDLQANLFDLVGKDMQAFNEHVDNAMMVADVIGFVHADSDRIAK